MGAAESKQQEDVFLDAQSGDAEVVKSTPGGSKKAPVSRLYRMVQKPSGSAPDGRTVGVWEAAAVGVKWSFTQGLADEDEEEEEEEEESEEFLDADFTEEDWFLVIPGCG